MLQFIIALMEQSLRSIGKKFAKRYAQAKLRRKVETDGRPEIAKTHVAANADEWERAFCRPKGRVKKK